jgi:hypothetical protein
MITVYYSNEAMLSRWDLTRAEQNREALIQRQEARDMAKAEKAKYGPRGILK